MMVASGTVNKAFNWDQSFLDDPTTDRRCSGTLHGGLTVSSASATAGDWSVCHQPTIMFRMGPENIWTQVSNFDDDAAAAEHVAGPVYQNLLASEGKIGVLPSAIVRPMPRLAAAGTTDGTSVSTSNDGEVVTRSTAEHHHHQQRHHHHRQHHNRHSQNSSQGGHDEVAQRLTTNTDGGISAARDYDVTSAAEVRADLSPTALRRSSVTITPRSSPTPSASETVPVTNDPAVFQLAESRLKESGFYFGRISPTEARRLLAAQSPGTFLVRASSDPRHLFSLSVRTARDPPGVTSVRIIHDRTTGHFRLDGDPDRGMDRLPAFPCVVQLIRHHVRVGFESGIFVFLERCGSGVETPVLLRRPLPVEDRPSTLRHLCRLGINAALNGRSVDRLQLVPSLKQYLKDYPSDM